MAKAIEAEKDLQLQEQEAAMARLLQELSHVTEELRRTHQKVSQLEARDNGQGVGSVISMLGMQWDIGVVFF